MRILGGMACAIVVACGCSGGGRDGVGGSGLAVDMKNGFAPIDLSTDDAPEVDKDALFTMYNPVRSLQGLTSIDFYERSGGTAPTKYTFTVTGPELSTRLPDPLSASNKDIMGVATEFYDVYYSDDDGTFNLDGAYLTISGVFGQTMAQGKGGGLNLAEIQLNFSGAPPELGTLIGSFVALGDNAIPGDVAKCIDGDLQTTTTMGNTVGSTQRLRITLGFPSTVIIQ